MPFENTIELWGFVIKPIHVQIGYLLFLFIFGVAGAYIGRVLLRMWRERGNRQFDHYLDTRTFVSEPDENNVRTAYLRNIGEPVRAEYVLRGNRVRGWLMSAAGYCDWETRRFIKDADPDRQEKILHMVRNTLTRHFREGEIAHMAELPTRRFDLFFAPTGADATVGGVRMIRTMIATRTILETFLTHPADKWRFEEDKVTGLQQVDHVVRVRTMRDMAEALIKDRGMRIIDGTDKKARIVGWMEVRVPCRPEEAN
jgi:hypothetical protein